MQQLVRLWLLAFAGFSLVIGAWSVAAPYDGSPDELNHIVRAVGVVSGQIAPDPVAASFGTGAYQTVPAGLVRNNCWAFRPERSAACAQKPNGDKTPVRQATMVGRYSPAYYVFVGVPMMISPTMKGVLLSRLISAAMSAALLAAAVVSIVSFSRFRLMLAGLLLAVTPMAVEVASAVNPNGVEIAAGIAFVASVIPMLLGAARERPPTWLVCVAVTSAVVLVSVRSSGPILLALAAAALLPLRWVAVRDLLRVRSLRWGMIVVGVAAVASVLWVVRMKATVQMTAPGPHEIVKPGELAIMELNRWPVILQQMVGVLAHLDSALSAPAYFAWQHLATVLLIVALVVGGWTDRARLTIMVGGAVAFFAAYETSGFNKYGIGLFGQARYILPLLGGGLVFAAWILEERGLSAEHCRRLIRLVVVVTLPIQLHGLWVTMVRYQKGIPQRPSIQDYNPLEGSWHPVVGSVTPLVMAVIGLAVIGWIGWRYAAQRPAPPANQSVSDEGAGTSLQPCLAS